MAVRPTKVAFCLLFLVVLSQANEVQRVASVTRIRRFNNLLLHQVLKSQPDKSVVLSAQPIQILLAILTLGAEGATLTEALETIYTRDKCDTKDVYGGMVATLKSWTEVNLNVANKVYVSDGFCLNPSFESDVRDVFLSEVELINFGECDAAAGTINSWVEEQTDKNIKDLIKPDSLSSDTRLVLVNALYFKGVWDKPFNPKNTKKDQKFNLLNGKTSKVSMMSQNGKFLYGEIPKIDAKAIEMFYKGNEFSMVVILPNKKDGILDIQRNLQSSTKWIRLLRDLSECNIQVSLPRFRVETEIDLTKLLPELGAELIFDSEKSELSSILDSCSDILYASQFVQKVSIAVNEEGTTAAAATAAVINTKTGLPKPPQTKFIADRPFLFFIRDALKQILFMGIYKGESC